MKEEKNKTECNIPQGQLILKTLAMPADTNINGDIFGGWIMSQMDISGGVLSKEITNSRTVTVAVQSMTFVKPVHVGDIVCFYGKTLKIGKTSITLDLEVWVQAGHYKDVSCPHIKVTEAIFVYVAIDENGNKKEIKR